MDLLITKIADILSIDMKDFRAISDHFSVLFKLKTILRVQATSVSTKTGLFSKNNSNLSHETTYVTCMTILNVINSDVSTKTWITLSQTETKCNQLKVKIQEG